MQKEECWRSAVKSKKRSVSVVVVVRTRNLNKMRLIDSSWFMRIEAYEPKMETGRVPPNSHAIDFLSKSWHTLKIVLRFVYKIHGAAC
jgi:hypothetical protein